MTKNFITQRSESVETWHGAPVGATRAHATSRRFHSFVIIKLSCTFLFLSSVMCKNWRLSEQSQQNSRYYLYNHVLQPYYCEQKRVFLHPHSLVLRYTIFINNTHKVCQHIYSQIYLLAYLRDFSLFVIQPKSKFDLFA